MAQFRFKIKGYLNETGEYSALHTTESGTILQFILQHWFNETLPNNLDIIYIENENGDRLVIDHLKRDIFDYYLIERKSKKGYYHKKTDIQFMFFALESFFNQRNQDLRHNLRYSNDDADFICGNYIGKDFHYQVTYRKIWQNVDSLLYPLLVVIAAMVMSFFTSWIVMIVGVAFGFLFTFSMYQTLMRLRMYYHDNQDISIRLSRGDEVLRVTKGTWTRDIPKSDIRKVVKYVHPVADSRLVAEYHTEIEFLNGNVLNLTCLLLPQDQVELKFSNDLVPIEYKPAVDGKSFRPTQLERYFSAIRPLGATDPLKS